MRHLHDRSPAVRYAGRMGLAPYRVADVRAAHEEIAAAVPRMGDDDDDAPVGGCVLRSSDEADDSRVFTIVLVLALVMMGVAFVAAAVPIVAHGTL